MKGGALCLFSYCLRTDFSLQFLLLAQIAAVSLTLWLKRHVSTKKVPSDSNCYMMLWHLVLVISPPIQVVSV